MKEEKIMQQEFVLKINYLQVEKDCEGKILKSGIQIPTEHVEDDLRVDISDDPIFDWDTDEFIDSGKKQINLRGSKRAFHELGTLLIAMAHYKDDPNYHIHIDDIQNSMGQVVAHLIIHAPVEAKRSNDSHIL